MDNIKKFLSQASCHFITTGAFLPSTKFLAKRMIDKMKGKVIIELGPGTGIFTEEILRLLPKDGLLISIEKNKVFADYLSDKIKDKRFKLYNGDACNMSLYLEENGYQKVDYIVSGLPLGHFSREVNGKILSEAKAAAKEMQASLEAQTQKDIAEMLTKFENAIASERQVIVNEMRQASVKAAMALAKAH